MHLHPGLHGLPDVLGRTRGCDRTIGIRGHSGKQAAVLLAMRRQARPAGPIHQSLLFGDMVCRICAQLDGQRACAIASLSQGADHGDEQAVQHAVLVIQTYIADDRTAGP